METRDLYSIEEARKRLGGISRNSIYLMLRAGQLPSAVLGCRRFIAAKAIANLIASSSTLTHKDRATNWLSLEGGSKFMSAKT